MEKYWRKIWKGTIHNGNNIHVFNMNILTFDVEDWYTCDFISEDFDWGTFSFNASPAAQNGLFMQWAWWYGRLFDDPYFKALASERWEILQPKFETVFDFIEREREYISTSWDKNFKMWNISTNINGDEWLAKDEAIDRMVEITRKRIDIIDREL